MNCNPCATDIHVPVCSDELDPMGGATIPEGIDAVQTFVDGQTFWQTNPPLPPEETIHFLVQQNSGKILIDDGVYLII